MNIVVRATLPEHLLLLSQKKNNKLWTALVLFTNPPGCFFQNSL